jgi:hypothetical protein
MTLIFQFVHDLAGAHFSIETIELMNKNLPFVNNTTHPQNVLQARPIENLWCILALEICEGELKATAQQELISRMQSHLKNFGSKFLQRLKGEVKTKLRAIADRGVKSDMHVFTSMFYKHVTCM